MKASVEPFEPLRFLDEIAQAGLIAPAAARRAREASARAGTSLERTILEFGLVPEEALYRALATHLGLDFVEAGEIEPGLAAGLDLPREFLQRVEAVPVRWEEDTLVVASADPRGLDALDSIGFRLRVPLRPAMASPSAIRQALGDLAGPEARREGEGSSETDIERLRALANDGPVIKLVNEIVTRAALEGASDIHIEAEDHGARVRLRVDGALRTDSLIAEANRAAVVSRLKIMAGLNISEKRRPQDGRASLAVRGQSVDIRLSTLPTQHGESIVLRLLDRSRMRLDWGDLGYAPDRVAEITRLANAPNGIFLVAGPTGSGKTTTLYTALAGLNAEDRKIVTVEDPIEYALDGIAQVQVEPAIEMTFARALRAILRQDPDVIMVGEIRDQETAEIAVRAALVGRLVLSTVHTNDSLAAIDRMLDLGVPPYLLGATLRGVLSQRLVRRLCPDCRGDGCDVCGGSGRRGRIVVSELLRLTPGLAHLISTQADAAERLRQARGDGFESLTEDGRRLVEAGAVTEEDLLRAVGGEGIQ